MSGDAAPDLLVTGIGQLLTLAHDRPGPRVGPARRELGLVRDGALAVRDGRVAAVGPRERVLRERPPGPATRHVDAVGRVVMPGFVDCHTHLVFARWRLDEYAWRVAGTPYAEIAARGGGIAKSVADLHETDEETLYRVSRRRLEGCLRYGTTTIEIKSGYGLDLENELKQLRVIRRLADEGPARIVSTFLGAHAIPAAYRQRREAFVDEVVDRMIPAVVRGQLAQFIDVFCDAGVFTVAEAERILRAGQRAGLRARIHADELEDTGAAALAARIGAVSADHVTKTRVEALDAMARAGVVAVLLPGTSFGLPSLDLADAREMVERGVPVALASDFNPGSSPSESMPMMIAIACSHMRLQPEEAIVAATANAACVLGCEREAGSLQPGRSADFLVLDAADYREIPYRFGINPVAEVWIRGERWSPPAQ